ncbi:hypothetical protein E2C01_066937 [Portunus trituberculatus]|uniref:Uncharacterized protein n=1 Tax=Portunus trituberculatus TaxID=210409 RepID=A0A5B7HSB8_PORTR|nr:hypothetical protein [Portunus trituberculatus]
MAAYLGVWGVRAMGRRCAVSEVRQTRWSRVVRPDSGGRRGSHSSRLRLLPLFTPWPRLAATQGGAAVGQPRVITARHGGGVGGGPSVCPHTKLLIIGTAAASGRRISLRLAGRGHPAFLSGGGSDKGGGARWGGAGRGR